MSNLNLAAIFTTVAKSPSSENASALEVAMDVDVDVVAGAWGMDAVAGVPVHATCRMQHAACEPARQLAICINLD